MSKHCWHKFPNAFHSSLDEALHHEVLGFVVCFRCCGIVALHLCCTQREKF